MDIEAKVELAALIKAKRAFAEFSKIRDFIPYDYQREYINASIKYTTRFMMAGNRVGKSACAAYEIACHATGDYPDWWEGRKFDSHVRILAAGKTHSTVRDIMQEKLIGEPTNRDVWGSGMIPKSKLGKTARKAGVPDALSSVLVKHVSSGWSKITFLPYEAKKEAFMGSSMHFVNLDEEPPEDIYSQAVRSITDTDGIISITATPENGLTQLINRFQQDETGLRYIKRVEWDDCPHLTPEVKAKMLAELPEHEREMRSKGIPVFGSGLIYPVKESEIVCEPFQIPDHFLLIAGIDFGYDHPFAWVSVAWDREEDTIYVTECLKMEKKTPEQQVFEIQRYGGRAIPTAWPSDGSTSEKGTGISLRQQYSGLCMLPEPFMNPMDNVTGKMSRSVEAGIMDILTHMQNGKFKIFSSCTPLIEEMRVYHRKDGKIQKSFDDAMDAMRYAVMSRNHGRTAKHKFKAYIPHEEDYQDSSIAY